MKALAVGVVLAAALAATAAAAEGRSTAGAAAERVTIFARPTVLGQGQRLTLFGSVDSTRAEEIVTIQVKECGSTWFRGVAAARTRVGGGWSLDHVNPAITATVRAVWRDVTSAPITVRQRAWVNLRTKPGSATEFFVSAWRHRGKRVRIQRFERRLGTWTTIKSVALDASSAQTRFTASVPKGSLMRAFMPLAQAKPCYLAGTSRIVRT